MFAAGPDDVWIGGDAGTLLHWDGTSIAAVALPRAPTRRMPVLDICTASPPTTSGCRGATVGSDVIVATGFTSHFDGTAWSPVEVLTFAAGSAPTPCRASGRWRRTTSGRLTDRELSGGVPLLWHFDGTAWSELHGSAAGSDVHVSRIGAGGSFVFGPHDRWAVGARGPWQRNTM